MHHEVRPAEKPEASHQIMHPEAIPRNTGALKDIPRSGPRRHFRHHRNCKIRTSECNTRAQKYIFFNAGSCKSWLRALAVLIQHNMQKLGAIGDIWSSIWMLMHSFTRTMRLILSFCMDHTEAKRWHHWLGSWLMATHLIVPLKVILGSSKQKLSTSLHHN